MSRRWNRALVAVVALCTVASVLRGENAAAGIDAKAAFEKIKGLAGTWEGTGSPDAPGGAVTLQYRVTGGGSAVIETLFPGTPHEMVTVFHLDGDDVVLTHYCAAGNQPRMKLDKAASRGDQLRFTFSGGSNVDAAKGFYMHDVRMVLQGSDKLEETWTSFRGGKKENAAVFHVARKAG